MSPDLLAWVVCLAVAVLALHFIPVWKARKRGTRKQTVEQRVMVNAMVDWLQQPKIAQCVIETGSYTHKQLQAMFEALPWMNEYELRVAAQKMLQDRMTRRVVATYMEKAHGTDKSEIMKSLLEWAGVAA